MLVFDVIRSEKRDLSISPWRNGTIPQAAYPVLRRARALGRGWQWRTVKFQALDEKFILLVALSEEKEYFRAILGWYAVDGFRVLCHHELHTSHFGWHCHFCKGDVNAIEPKKTRDNLTFIRWPSFPTDECGVRFDVTYDNALTKAAERFRFSASEEPTLL